MRKVFEGPYNKNKRSLFSFTKDEERTIENLQNKIQHSKGVHVLAGNRGSGKTSLKNRSIELCNSDNGIIIDISNYTTEEILLKEILNIVNGWLLKQITTTNNDIKNYIRTFSILGNESYLLFHPTYSKEKEEAEEEYLKNDGFYQFEEWVRDIWITWVQLEQKLNQYNFKFDGIKNLSSTLRDSYSECQILFGSYSLSLKDRIKRQNLKYKKFDLIVLKQKFENFSDEINKLFKIVERYEFLLSNSTLSQEQLEIFDKEIIYKNERNHEKQKSKSENIQTNMLMKLDIADNNKLISIFKASIGKNKSTFDEKKNTFLEYTKYSTTGVYTFFQKKEQLFKLLYSISQQYYISIIIDEMDKQTSENIKEIINDNKRLFIDTNLMILLIMDIYSYINIKDTPYIYSSDSILVPSLSFQNYYLKSRNMGQISNFKILEVISRYFADKANIREMLKGGDKSHYKDYGYLYISFLSSDFYLKLSDIYKEVFSNFFLELLSYLEQVDGISIAELEFFIEEFYTKNNISNIVIKSLFNTLKNLILENKLLSKGFRYVEWLPHFYSKELKEYTQHYNSLELKFGNTEIDTHFLYSNYLISPTFIYQLEELFKNLFEKAYFKKEITTNFCLEAKNSTSMNSKFRFADSKEFPIGQSDGIRDASQVVIQYFNQISGVIIFTPKNVLENPENYPSSFLSIIVLRDNLEELIGYDYLNVSEIYNHYSEKFDSFISFLEINKIQYYVTNDYENTYFVNCFNYFNKNNLNESIKREVEKHVPRWIRKMKKEFLKHKDSKDISY